MSFANPEYFWFLLLLIPAAGLLYWAYIHGRSELLKMGGAWRGPRLHSIYLIKGFLSGLLVLLTFAALVTAWAGPSWGNEPVEEPQQGLDIGLVFDVSRSMTATDVLPSRLDRAKEAVQLVVSSFPGARFSLVVFEGSAVCLTPLTPDQGVLVRWFDQLSPALTTASGSSLPSGIDEGVRTLGYSAQRHRVLIVFSDGESRDGSVRASARKAGAEGVEIFALGFGTPEGAQIPDHDGVLRDDFGFPVRTRLVLSNLQILAEETGGRAFLGSDRGSLRELQDLLSNLSNPASRGGVTLEPVPRYRVFLLMAIFFLTGFLAVRIIPWKGIF